MTKGFITPLVIITLAALSAFALGYPYLNQSIPKGEIQSVPEEEAVLGADPRIITSSQVGTNPTDGYVLQTTGTSSEWVATSTLGISGGGGAGATTTINGVNGPTFTFATGTATGIGLTIATSSGTLTFTPTVTSGYSIPLTASTTNWETAYGWGDHSVEGYLKNIVEDTTPQLGGTLDAQGNSIDDLANITFRTGATGGTIRTGTSNADKYTLQAYDVNDTTYRTLFEADAGNDVVLQIIGDYLAIEDATDTTKHVEWDLSGATTSSATTLTFNQTAARTITFPDTTGTLALTSDLHNAVTLAGEDYLSLATQQITANAINADNLSSSDFGDFTCDGVDCEVDASFLAKDLAWTGTGTTTFAGNIDVAGTVEADVFNAVTTITSSGDLNMGGNDITNVGTITATNASLTNATTSVLTVTGITSALGLYTSTGLLTEYTGIDCTNQFVRDVGADGAGTCASVVSADITNGTIVNDDINASAAIAYSKLNLAGSLVETDLNANAPTDDYVLTASSTATGGFVWAANPAGGNTLDAAYDQGGAGSGRSITADSGAVAITVPDTSNNAGLTIVQNDATNDPLALEVNGKQAAGVSKVTASTLVQFNDTNGANSDWAFNVAGGGYPAMNLQSTGGTLSSPTETGSSYSGRLFGYAYNSTPAQFSSGSIGFVLDDTTASSEDTHIDVLTYLAGTSATRFKVGDGVNGISVGSNSAIGVVESNGNQDLILQTGNPTTGNITITDGANGNITLSPNGTGLVALEANTRIATSSSLSFGESAILSDSSGTLTLSNVDALDATTETTIESAIDTLANLTSASSLVTVGTITSGTWNATIADGLIVEPDLSADNSPGDGDYLTYDSTGTNFVWRTVANVASDIQASITTLANLTAFIFPNGTNPTADDPGEAAWDTTDNQLIIDDKVFASEVPIYGFQIASTSAKFASSTVIDLPQQRLGYTVTTIACYVTSGTSIPIHLFGETLVCTTNGTEDDGTIASPTVTALATTTTVTMGSPSGSVDDVNISIFGNWTRQ